MKTNTSTPKETDAANQETEVALDGATCSAPPAGSSCDTCGNTEIPPVLVTIESLGDAPRMQEAVMLGKYPESTFADLDAGVVWSCGKCLCVGFNVPNR